MKTEEQLRKYISCLENYEAEKQEVLGKMKEVLNEAKFNGFDTKIIKKLLKLKRLTKEKRQEEQGLLETYADAIQLELF